MRRLKTSWSMWNPRSHRTFEVDYRFLKIPVYISSVLRIFDQIYSCIQVRRKLEKPKECFQLVYERLSGLHLKALCAIEFCCSTVECVQEVLTIIQMSMKVGSLLRTFGSAVNSLLVCFDRAGSLGIDWLCCYIIIFWLPITLSRMPLSERSCIEEMVNRLGVYVCVCVRGCEWVVPSVGVCVWFQACLNEYACFSYWGSLAVVDNWSFVLWAVSCLDCLGRWSVDAVWFSAFGISKWNRQWLNMLIPSCWNVIPASIVWLKRASFSCVAVRL